MRWTSKNARIRIRGLTHWAYCWYWFNDFRELIRIDLIEVRQCNWIYEWLRRPTSPWGTGSSKGAYFAQANQTCRESRHLQSKLLIIYNFETYIISIYLHKLEVLQRTRFWGPFGRPKSLNPSTRDNLTIDTLDFRHFGRKTVRNLKISVYKTRKQTVL